MQVNNKIFSSGLTCPTPNDYMHWYGWAPLKTAVNTILEEEKRMRAEHDKKG